MTPERFFLHLRSATKRYRESHQDIAADFVRANDSAIAKIVADPQRWPLKNGWRRYYLKRFPFTVAYREAGELIEIGAIAHQKRRPDSSSRASTASRPATRSSTSSPTGSARAPEIAGDVQGARGAQ